MIEFIANMPENVVAVKGSGKVTAKDYDDVLVPSIEDKLGKHKKIRMLYELGRDFSGFTPGAMWDDAKVGIRHITAFEKIAVVSDIEWIHAAVNVFAFLIPCPARVFGTAELNEAKHWVSE